MRVTRPQISGVDFGWRWRMVSVSWLAASAWAVIASIGLGLGSLSAAQPPGPAAAPVRSSVYPGINPTAEALLRSADGHARAEKWEEAITIYLRVMDQFGDRPTQVPKDHPLSDPTGASTLFIDIREYCQRRIAALPPDGRALYRAKTDAQAERWYRDGRDRRDPELLRRVVDFAFCGSWGDDALETAADWAYQDGNYAEALDGYRRLLPDRGDARDPALGGHPDPSTDLARVAAKKLICRAAIGENPPVAADLEAFAKRFAGAKGKLAGREGPYAEILAEALKADGWIAEASSDSRWTTFAGSPTRSRVAEEGIEIGLGSFQWKLKFDPLPQSRPIPNGYSRFGQFSGVNGGGSNLNRPSLPYHPIILGDEVIFSNDRQTFAYSLSGQTKTPKPNPNLKPGADLDPDAADRVVKEKWKSVDRSNVGGPVARGFAPPPPRFTQTAHNGLIYCRVGASQLTSYTSRSNSSAIIALDDRQSGKVVWKKEAKSSELAKPADNGEERAIGFEGAPLADDQGVYVAATEGGGGMLQTHVVCFDHAHDNGKGRIKWKRFLFQTNSGNDGRGGNFNPFGGIDDSAIDLGRRLLTLDAATLYYQTNLGAVAAIDARNGRLRWLAAYPHNPLLENSRRDLNPAIVHDGLVIVAPQDCDSILAFDAATGKRVWSTSKDVPLREIEHLLGVAEGRLIATGDHVFMFDITNGKLIRRWPDSPAGYNGHGRGVLAGGRIYWPTKSEIHVLAIDSGLRDRPPIKLTETFGAAGGNLAIGDGYLVIAQEDQLAVYCQNRRLIQRYREVLAQAPEHAPTHYRLGQAAEREEDFTLALASYETTIAKAKPADLIDDRPLREEARERRFRLLMRLGRDDAGKRVWEQAASRFREARAAALDNASKLSASMQWAEALENAGRPVQAVAALQDLLGIDGVRRLTISAEDQRTIRADLMIAQRLDRLIQAQGRALYAEQDQTARALLARGVAEKDVRPLEEIERLYPVAESLPEATLALASLYEERGQSALAAAAHRRLLASNAVPGQWKGRALWGLAQAYERQGLWISAREAYERVRADYGRVNDAQGRSFGDLASAKLIEERFARIGSSGGRKPSAPMDRRWEKRWPSSESFRPLIASGAPPSPQVGRVIMAGAKSVRLLDPFTGESPWVVDVPDKPVWAGFVADRLIVGSASRAVALRIDDGRVEWTFPPSAASKPVEPGREGANPFVKAQGAANFVGDEGRGLIESGDPNAASPRADDPERRVLKDFRIVGDRIFALRGSTELLTLDAATGQVEWSFAPPVGRINERVGFGPRTIVLQVREPNQIVALDVLTGKRAADFPQDALEPAWVREPLFLNDRLIVAAIDNQTVRALDLSQGSVAWTRKVWGILPALSRPPLLLGDERRVLAVVDGRLMTALDGVTGAEIWNCPLGHEDLSERPDAFVIDDKAERFYHVSDAVLQAVSLKDGLTLWQQRLAGPDSGWSVALAENGLVLHPAPSRIRRMAASGRAEPVPLAFRRRDDGALIQRLAFPPAQALAIVWDADSALIATDSGAWSLVVSSRFVPSSGTGPASGSSKP